MANRNPARLWLKTFAKKAQLRPGKTRTRQNQYLYIKKNGSGIFSLRSRYDNCLKLSWPGLWCFCRCFFLSALWLRLVVLGSSWRSTTWWPTRVALSRQVFLAVRGRMVQAKYPRAVRSRQVVVVHQVYLCPARTVKATGRPVREVVA